MINEKMLELFLLYQFINDIPKENMSIENNTRMFVDSQGNWYNLGKMIERTNSLISEFLEPYVINSDSKE